MVIDEYLKAIIYTMDGLLSLKHSFEVYYSQKTYQSIYLNG